VDVGTGVDGVDHARALEDAQDGMVLFERVEMKTGCPNPGVV
jgi:hypothetical protein